MQKATNFTVICRFGCAQIGSPHLICDFFTVASPVAPVFRQQTTPVVALAEQGAQGSEKSRING
jgi:hypothetical protein